PRRRAAGIRSARREARRAERSTLPAGRLSRGVELSAPILLRGSRRRPVPARNLHVLATDFLTPQLTCVRCSVPRGVRTPAHQLRHASSVAGFAERSHLRGGRARVCRAFLERRRFYSGATDHLGILSSNRTISGSIRAQDAF